jgi:benzoyl-CoA reductase/2-hydroxyglutaryl-CoA dehydratase subunit BcrC/BadD/HgdB
MTDTPESAGLYLHDNMCPHVKKILDRIISGDIPELSGMVLMNSCDAMRRLFDAHKAVRGTRGDILIDLPVVADESGLTFFAGELRRLSAYLESLSGKPVDEESIKTAISDYNRLADALKGLADKVHSGRFRKGSATLQFAYNIASTQVLAESIDSIQIMSAKLEGIPPGNKPPAIFLFGNVLPDPEAFELFEDCGAHIVEDDLCTGSRMFQPIIVDDAEDIFTSLARAILNRRPCVRTFDCNNPGRMAGDILERVRALGADGVVCHTAKFCDPYLARLPFVIETLKNDEIPILMLEGDCTTRSMEQQRTRIEAFIEMLG